MHIPRRRTLFIDAISPEAATGDLAAIYESETERWGFLPNFVRTFSHHPDAYRAWLTLAGTLYAGMDRRRCELATLAAARTLRSTCCSVAHGKMLRDRFVSAEQLARIAADHHDAGLDAVDVAIMDFAEKAARDASTVTQSDIDALRAEGLADREIFDVAFAVAVRAFFATLIESLGTSAEQAFVSDLEPVLVDALAVGRPTG